MARKRRVPIAAGWWNDLTHGVSQSKAKATAHKEKALEHRRRAEQIKNTFGYGLNPLAWAMHSHHESQAKRHEIDQAYHEDIVNSRQRGGDDDEKRDPKTGRWAASFSSHTGSEGDSLAERNFRSVLNSGSATAMRAWLVKNDPNGDYDDANARQLKQSMLRVWNTNKIRQRGKGMAHKGKGMTRRQRYEAKCKAKACGVTGGLVGAAVGTIVLPIVGTAIGAYIGHRLQERGIQAKKTADALEILVKNAQQAQEVKQIAQEAGVKPQMKGGAASMGAGSDLLKGVQHVAKNPKLVLDFASKAAATAAAGWLTARYCQAVTKGTIVAVSDMASNTISDIRMMCRKLGGTLKAIGGPEPEKNASLAYGPGKTCGPNSRRAKYMAKCGKALATSPFGQAPNDSENPYIKREGIEPETVQSLGMSFSLLNHVR